MKTAIALTALILVSAARGEDIQKTGAMKMRMAMEIQLAKAKTIGVANSFVTWERASEAVAKSSKPLFVAVSLNCTNCRELRPQFETAHLPIFNSDSTPRSVLVMKDGLGNLRQCTVWVGRVPTPEEIRQKAKEWQTYFQGCPAGNCPIGVPK